MGRLGTAAIGILALAAVAPTVVAQPPRAGVDVGDATAFLEAALADLASPSVQTRIDATQRLMSETRIPLRQIEDVLKRPDLNLEQRERLLAVAFRRFLQQPRAAMGIGPDNVFGTHGVTLGDVRPNFPAAAHLKVGDRIIAVDGVTIDSWERIRAVILSHDPEDKIPVVLVREGVTRTVEVTLGRFEDLRQPGSRAPGPTDPALMDAWELRSRPLRGAEASEKPIASGLEPASWGLAAHFDEMELSRMRALDPDPTRTGVVAGGEARGGVPVAALGGGARRALEQRIAPLEGGVRDADALRAAVQRMIDEHMQRRQELTVQLALLQRQLNDPNLPKAAREAVQAQIDAVTRELKVREEQIRRLAEQFPLRP